MNLSRSILLILIATVAQAQVPISKMIEDEKEVEFLSGISVLREFTGQYLRVRILESPNLSDSTSTVFVTVSDKSEPFGNAFKITGLINPVLLKCASDANGEGVRAWFEFGPLHARRKIQTVIYLEGLDLLHP